MFYGKSNRIIDCVYIVLEEGIYRKFYEVVEIIVGRKIYERIYEMNGVGVYTCMFVRGNLCMHAEDSCMIVQWVEELNLTKTRPMNGRQGCFFVCYSVMQRVVTLLFD